MLQQHEPSSRTWKSFKWFCFELTSAAGVAALSAFVAVAHGSSFGRTIRIEPGVGAFSLSEQTKRSLSPSKLSDYLLAAYTLPAQADARPLEPGQTIERELAGGDVHAYSIKLAAHQFLHAVVEQRGVDVVVTLFDPDKKRILEVDSPNGTQGPEPVWFVCEVAGTYRLEVRSLEQSAPAGRYGARIEELREATTQDPKRVTAQLSLLEGEQLLAEGTADSLHRAEPKLAAVLILWRELGDRAHEARTLEDFGRVFALLSQNEKALDYYNQALLLRQTLQDRDHEASLLINIGQMYSRLGQTQKAPDFFERARATFHELGNTPEEARALNSLGMTYNTLGEPRKALDHLEQALKMFQSVGDRQAEAVALNNLGLVYDHIGETQKALDYYDRSLPIRRAIGDRRGESVTLSNLAQIYSLRGEKKRALDSYQAALAISHAIGDRSGEAATLLSIGSVYVSLGEPTRGLSYFFQALPIFQAIKDRSWEATSLNNIGVAYNALGDKQKALDFYEQGLTLRRDIREPHGEAVLLLNIGLLYSSLGNLEKALDCYTKARVISKNIGERLGEGRALNSIGFAEHLRGESGKALDYFNQALPILQAIGDRLQQATTLNNMGLAHDALGQRQRALESYRAALKLLQEIGDLRTEALTLTNVGTTYSSLGETEKGRANFDRALVLSRQVGERTTEAAALLGLARIERDGGNYPDSLEKVEAALMILESVRAGLHSQDLRASYFASVQAYYQFYIDLLMRMHRLNTTAGYDARALQISERARARSLLEMLRESGADIRQGINPDLLEREKSLKQLLNAKAERQIRFLSSQHTAAQAAEVKKELDDLVAQHDQVEAQIRATSPRYAALTQPVPLSVPEIQRNVLDSETVLLEYALGDEHSYLWLVTATNISSYQLPQRATIEAMARRVYEALTVRNRHPKFETMPERRRRIAVADQNYVIEASRLSQMLLGPVAAQLQNKRLLVVTEGALQYVPFAALPVPQSEADNTNMNGIKSRNPGPGPSGSAGPSGRKSFVPIVVRNEVVSVPSASTLAVLRQELAGRQSATKTVMVMADPVFEKEDERVQTSLTAQSAASRRDDPDKKRSFDGGREPDLVRSARDTDLIEGPIQIKRLAYTRREADRITALVPPSESRKALDFEANRTAATSTDISQYRYLHFATHGYLNSAHPELSGIVLSLVDKQGAEQDGFLRVHQIFNLNLQADLVVLSACRTGLGREVKGEGLVGMTRAFIYAGAARVLVSLWDIADEASAELMVELYREMFGKERLRPSAALRAAQIKVWKQKRWQAPYYWAGFILQGEPR